MADELTDDQAGQALDYLGRQQPALSQRLKTLPSASAAGGGAVASPVTGAGGTGVGTGGPGGAGPGAGAEGGPLAAAAAARRAGPSALSLAQQSASAASKAGKFASDLMGSEDLGTRGTFGGPGTPQDAQTSLSDTVRSGAPATAAIRPPESINFMNEPADLPPGSEGAFAETASGAGDLASGLGTGASGAGALAAILGLIAAATGEKDLGKAASAVGGAASVAGTAGAGASAAAGTAGLAAAGALGASPVAAGLLVGLIGQLTGNEDLPFQIGPAPDPYAMFGEHLGNTLGTESTGLTALYKALPTVGSRAELSQLLDAFKKNQAGRIGGYGEGSDPFTIPALPGAGGSAHEWKQTADYGVPVDQLNEAIQGLLPFLPETGAEGSMPGSQLWNTVLTNLDRERARSSGLNMDQLATMSPEDRAATLAQFPEDIAMPDASSAWTQYRQSLQRPAAPPSGKTTAEQAKGTKIAEQALAPRTGRGTTMRPIGGPDEALGFAQQAVGAA